MSSSRILVATVGAPHGVRGEVRLKAHTGDPLAVADYRDLFTADGRVLTVVSARPAKEVLVVRLAGIDTRDEAEALKGLDLFVPRTSLEPPEDDETFYHADLIGLDVVAADGTRLGRVVSVQDFGAGDLIEIAADGSASGELLPFTKAFFPEVDLAHRRLVVDPPNGFLSNNRQQG